MNIWVQIILTAAALTGAIGVLWSKVFRPLFKFINIVEETLPVLRNLTLTFQDDPTVFKVLDSIADEFRTNSGSSLRDVVNRLETAADASALAIEKLTKIVLNGQSS